MTPSTVTSACELDACGATRGLFAYALATLLGSSLAGQSLPQALPRKFRGVSAPVFVTSVQVITAGSPFRGCSKALCRHEYTRSCKSGQFLLSARMGSQKGQHEQAAGSAPTEGTSQKDRPRHLGDQASWPSCNDATLLMLCSVRGGSPS